MIEARVIRLRERNHKFTRPLIAAENANTSIRQSLGIHQRNQLEQEIRLRLEEVRCFTFDRSLELFGVITRDAVPSLGLAPMHYRTFPSCD